LPGIRQRVRGSGSWDDSCDQEPAPGSGRCRLRPSRERLHQLEPVAEGVVGVDAVVALERLVFGHAMAGGGDLR